MATETIVSMVLERLLPVIENKVRGQVSLLLNADENVKALSSKLEKIRDVLADAEGKGITNSEVKFWLDDLREIAYEIDFAIDEWEVENIRQKFEEVNARAKNIRQKVKACVQSICFCFKQTVRRRGIALHVRQINERLDTIAQRSKDEFKFVPNLGFRGGMVSRPQTTTTSFVDEGGVRGRDPEKETIKKKLLSEDGDDLQIILIFGTGGMGKTTLAQIVFKEVKGEFDKAMWVYVSDPFDQIKVAQSILEALDDKSPDVSSLQALLGRIQMSVSGKKFILVLDDVWTEDYKTWEPFRIALKSGSRGSRILVTTRKSTVAEQVMASAYTHELGQLSDSDCCSVLEQRAFSGRNISSGDRETLRGVAMEIAKKCNGMPLAATIIGSLLRFKTSLEEWENVLESEWWDEMIEGVFPFLALSYNELDPVVKRCFLFCAIFPKGYLIEVDSLVRVWMAQGFLASSGSKAATEQKGRDYFRDLQARSLFQDCARHIYDQDRMLSFRIHDVVRDFARSLTMNECLVAEDKSNDDGVSLRNIRHLNLKIDVRGQVASSSTTDIATALSSVDKGNLHSLLLYRSYVFPSDIFSQLKRVKWLRLSHCYLKYVPKEIGRLIHLRLLDLSGNPIKKLPETICELYNLQTLDISYCRMLSGLPQKIERLMNLTHIQNTWTDIDDFQFPIGFEKLTGLQTLQYYHCNKLGYLKDMNQLRGSLFIGVTKLSKFEAKRADLKSKRFLRELTLVLRENVRYEAIEWLRPHRDLRALDIRAQKIPSWLTDNFDKLRELDLWIYPIDKIHHRPLPCLGRLRSLERLCMYGMKAMKRIGNEFLGIDDVAMIESFPKLRILEFKDCGSWEEWNDITEDEENNNTIRIFPRLEELSLQECGAIMSLPVRLLSKARNLKRLKIASCPQLRRSYKKGDKWNFSEHIPHVEISEDEEE